MNNKRLQFIYSPRFNEKGIIIRSLFFLIFDVMIIKLLFTYSSLKYVAFYINLRLTLTTIFYLIRMTKYSFVFIKHRLDVFIIKNNTELQDELYKDYNIHLIEAKRNINSNGKKRGKVEEVIITNYVNER